MLIAKIIMLALTLSSSAFVAPLTPAGRSGVAISMIGGRDGQVNAGGNGKWAPAWKTKPFTAEGAASLQPPVQVESDEPAAAPAAAASAAGATTVVQAMKFMQDPTLAGISLCRRRGGSASWPLRRLVSAPVMPQAARIFGQPRLVSRLGRLGRAGRLYRACFRHDQACRSRPRPHSSSPKGWMRTRSRRPAASRSARTTPSAPSCGSSTSEPGRRVSWICRRVERATAWADRPLNAV